MIRTAGQGARRSSPGNRRLIPRNATRRWLQRLFDDAGNIGQGSAAFLQGWMDKYVAWVKQHTALPVSGAT
jgi:hypothetical protein